MKTVFLRVSFFVLLTTGPVTEAKEADNLTDRYKPLPDSTEIFDREMNRRLQDLQKEATSEGIACGDARKLRILFHDLNDSRFFIGSLESWAEDNPKVTKRSLEAQNSIYEGVLENGWIFNRLKLASTVKVNGQLIGTDKFGHFIDQGFEFYTPYRRSGYQMATALSSSLGSEKSYSGGASTGTISYADSMANYQGILFYHALAEGPNPYFRCTNGKWTQVREFRWADYVDAGWDEGINCNELASPEAQRNYQKNISKLEAQAQKNKKTETYTCPVSKEACSQLRERYVSVEKYVLSPECRKVARAGRSGGASQETATGKGVR